MAKRTKEEIQEWREKMKKLAATTRELSESQQEEIVKRCGTLTAEGHQLSPYNTCFLWMQAEEPLAQVGGFQQWKRVGRIVSKGQHAIGFIYVPIGKKKNTGEETDEKASRMRFKLVAVYDVKQTEVLADIESDPDDIQGTDNLSA